MQELRHALAVQPGDVAIDSESLDAEDLLTPCCQGLVSIDEQSRIIRLVHKTAEDYFYNHRSELFLDAHARILRTCLIYLSFAEFQQGPCQFTDFRALAVDGSANGKRIAKKRFLPWRLANNPLLQYAASSWGRHVLGELETTFQTDILTFLNRSMHLKSAAQVQEHNMLYCRPITAASLEKISRNLPLYVVTSFGLTRIASTLLSATTGFDLDSPYGHPETTLLHQAVESGNAEMTCVLLAAGVDTQLRSREASSQANHTVLHKAIGKGYHMIVDNLLSHDGGTVSEPDAICLAAFSEDEIVIRSMLSHLHDPTARQERLQTIFYQAARLGKTSSMKLALELGAGFDQEHKNGQTALFVAVKHGRFSAVELLVKAGASMGTKDSSGRSLLQSAAASLELFEERLNA